MAKELNEDSGFKVSIKTLIAIGAAMATIIGMWFALQADIAEAKELPKVYDSKGLTTSTLDIMLRVYVHKENATAELESTMQDIEFVIYNMDTEQYGMMDVQVASMGTDKGLLDPYGVGEVGVTVQYDVTD